MGHCEAEKYEGDRTTGLNDQFVWGLRERGKWRITPRFLVWKLDNYETKMNGARTVSWVNQKFDFGHAEFEFPV